MRYAPEHKQETRSRVLRAARRLFRRHGYDGVGLVQIMKEAGLTHGGFYVHFPSKAALFAEALEDHHDFVERMRERPGPGREELAEQGLEIARAYLSPENRERVGRGCSLASLAPDTARSTRRARRAYGAALRDLAREFERGLADPRPDDPRPFVAATLCVGGLALSRAVGDRAFADAISAACTGAVERELAGGSLAG